MRILFLSQVIPYPPTAGPRIKTWHVLRYLASRGHEIILASFVRPEEMESLPAVKGICSQVHVVPIRRTKWIDGMSWLRSHLTGRPFLIERDDLRAMRALVNQLLKDETIHGIHADQLTMAQFALPHKGGGKHRPLLVFDAHNATWTIVERMGKTLPWHMRILKPLLTLETRRVKRYEGMIVKEFDHTLAVTDIDREYLRQALGFYAKKLPANEDAKDPDVGEASSRISVIPITIDISNQPVLRQPGSMDILALGSLNYPPNADGIRWFAQEVFPMIQKRLPAASMTIIGKNPPKDLLDLAMRNPDSITVTGFVPELKPYLERTALAVVPVRAGSGMRVRILEMFSLGIPVVTTTVGLEGIEAADGKEVLVADTPFDFSASVVRVLQDTELQKHLAANGRRLAEQHYDWRIALRTLNQIYLE